MSGDCIEDFKWKLKLLFTLMKIVNIIKENRFFKCLLNEYRERAPFFSLLFLPFAHSPEFNLTKRLFVIWKLYSMNGKILFSFSISKHLNQSRSEKRESMKIENGKIYAFFLSFVDGVLVPVWANKFHLGDEKKVYNRLFLLL